MNGPIRRVAIVSAVMFLALLLNVSWLSVARTDSLNANPQNRRTRDAEFDRDRGAILAGNTPIARSDPSKGQFSFQRVYPEGASYAHITGYYSYDYGRSGLEDMYNRELSGTSDAQFFERLMDSFQGQTPAGASVQTTINPRAQQAAVNALGSRKGAVVALNYRTGAVLAMVSTPSYDPNKLASTDLSTARQAWQQLSKDKDRPLTNRATREIYPPGSTFKLVTAAAALTDGMTADSTVPSPAKLRLPQTTIDLTNEVNCGGDTSSLAHALEVSCNTAFANLGLRLGADKLRAQARLFSFDSSFGGDIDSATSVFPESPDDPQTAMSAIGQYEVASTPLQMAVVAGGIANDGQVMEPFLVQEVRTPDLQILSSHHNSQMQRALSIPNARSLQNMMVGVVQNGTGRAAQVSGTTVGGKTGTAQSDPDRPPYAWFVGFAKDPDVAIAVFIEEADIQRSDIAGGRLGGPIFRQVVEALK